MIMEWKMLSNLLYNKFRHKDSGISIREEKDGSVSIYGLTE